MSDAPKPFWKPAKPAIPVRPGVAMDGLHDDTRKVLDAIAGLNLDGLEITSGYRDPNRNARAGGAKGSQHIEGRALDFNWARLNEEQRKLVLDTAIGAGGRGIGIYPSGNSFHIDTRATPAAWGPRGYRGSPVETFPTYAQASLAKLLTGQPLNPSVAAAARRGGNMPSQRLRVPVNKAPPQANEIPVTSGSPAMDGTPSLPMSAAQPPMSPEAFQTAVMNSAPLTGNEALDGRLKDDAVQRGYASWDEALKASQPAKTQEQDALAKLLSGQWG